MAPLETPDYYNSQSYPFRIFCRLSDFGCKLNKLIILIVQSGNFCTLPYILGFFTYETTDLMTISCRTGIIN